MSLRIQHVFLFLLCAANAIPVLACQQQGYQRFPKTLDQAIDRDGATPDRSAIDRRRSSGNRLTTRKNAAAKSYPGTPRTESLKSSNESTTRRPVSASKISTHRIMTNRAARSGAGSNAKFEFGTVMMFPAGDGRRVIGSSVYRAPRRDSVSVNSGMGPGSLVANTNQRPMLAQSSPLENAAANSAIATSVHGPERLLVNVPNEFEIIIANSSPRSATNIIVQLRAPDGLTISRLDRSAWLDETKRTVSWKVANLPSGNRTSIRYQAISVTPGRHRQQITIGMEGVFQGETTFDTVVSTPQGNGAAIGSRLNQ